MARTKTPTITNIGQRTDIEIRQGSSLVFDQLLELEGVTPPTPFDLTGCTVRAYIRRTVRSTEIVAKMTTEIIDATAGIIRYTLTDEETGAMEAGETMNSALSKYVWDSELEQPNGDVSPLLYGEFRLQPEVTRDEDEPVTP